MVHKEFYIFSNPDIQFNGFNTGSADNNNAQGIRNAACVIQNYFPPSIWGVTMSGAGTICFPEEGNIEPTIYTADILEPTPGFSGIPPYTYEWRWNTDGNFTEQSPGYLIGTDAQIEISTIYNCPRFFLRVTVTSSDGELESVTKVVNTSFCSPCNEMSFLENSSKEPNTTLFEREIEKKTVLNSEYLVYPNPTFSKINISKKEASTEDFHVQILDAYQRVLMERHVEKDALPSFDLSPYTGQSVWIHIQDEDAVYVHRVVVLNN